MNFGELTRKMAKNIEGHDNVTYYRHEVVDFKQRDDKKWEVST